MTKQTIELPREWLERLIHIANCPITYSTEYLVGYINSVEKFLTPPETSQKVELAKVKDILGNG